MAREEQLEATERLQAAWLRRMTTMLEDGTITSTDMATLARVLMHNGWSLDPATLPKNLRDKITTTNPDFDDDEDVIPLLKKRPA